MACVVRPGALSLRFFGLLYTPPLHTRRTSVCCIPIAFMSDCKVHEERLMILHMDKSDLLSAIGILYDAFSDVHINASLVDKILEKHGHCSSCFLQKNNCECESSDEREEQSDEQG